MGGRYRGAARAIDHRPAARFIPKIKIAGLSGVSIIFKTESSPSPTPESIILTHRASEHQLDDGHEVVPSKSEGRRS